MSGTVYRLTIPGNPHPKERAQVVRDRRGRSHSYTPATTMKAEGALQATARLRWPKVRPVKGRWTVELRFYRDSRRRCDLDNLAKTVQDALNGVLWVDDSDIEVLVLSKHVDRAKPRTELIAYREDPA